MVQRRLAAPVASLAPRIAMSEIGGNLDVMPCQRDRGAREAGADCPARYRKHASGQGHGAT
jgi:hypothetical protein